MNKIIYNIIAYLNTIKPSTYHNLLPTCTTLYTHIHTYIHIYIYIYIYIYITFILIKQVSDKIYKLH